MLEVNAIYFILLVEGFVLLLCLILLWILIAVFRLRRKGAAVRELAARFSRGREQRAEQTEAMLQAVHRLEGDDLSSALHDIDQHENEFIRLLIVSLKRGKSAHIETLDAALDRLIESYKCLQPRAEKALPEDEEKQQEIASLLSENDELRDELSAANNKLNDMIAEFGNMFGGGKDHELDLHQLKKMLAALQAGSEIDISV